MCLKLADRHGKYIISCHRILYSHAGCFSHLFTGEAEQRVINRSSVLLIYDEISFARLMTYLTLPAG